jgi:hypothetical protein
MQKETLQEKIKENYGEIDLNVIFILVVAYMDEPNFNDGRKIVSIIVKALTN